MTDDNRRKFHRLPCISEKSVVEADGHRADCQVIDESIGGFRIVGIDPLMLDKGQQMLLEHRGEVISVRCANVSRMKDGKLCIGLTRNEVGSSGQDKSSSEAALINPYFHLESGMGILCRLVAVLSESELKIEFPGGKQSDVAAYAISAVSREERQTQLEALESLSTLVAIYSADSPETDFEPTVDSILSYEFGG